MAKNLLLVDLENVHKIDLSLLDESYSAIIYVGAKQNPPKASKKKETAHRFQRVDFQTIEGSGKNALDFHIAFQLGRVFETAPQTKCIVLSKDKGFDSLLSHLNKNGMQCSRVESLTALVHAAPSPPVVESIKIPDAVETTEPLITCRRCRKASTIDHNGGKWCTNCGRFAVPPDRSLLPSMQPDFKLTKDKPSKRW